MVDVDSEDLRDAAWYQPGIPRSVTHTHTQSDESLCSQYSETNIVCSECGTSGCTVSTMTMKKALTEMQTLHAGCSKAEPKIFTPSQTPFPGAQDGQSSISCRWSLPLPTDPVWWRSMHAISSYRGNRPTPTPTHRQTGPITIHCTAASAQCNKDVGHHASLRSLSFVAGRYCDLFFSLSIKCTLSLLTQVKH